MNLPLRPDLTWPIPDWSQVALVEPKGDKNAYWTEAGDRWMTLLREFLGEPYQITESPNFWLISPLPANRAIEQIKWLERALVKIKSLLGQLAAEDLLGKCPVFIFGSDEAYYDYISNYYGDGEWAGSGGMYLNSGYGHFAIPQSADFNLSSALAHELTHSLIKNQSMPSWLNEGLTQLCEEAVSGRMSVDMSIVEEHIEAFWNPETIQTFWDGSGFKVASENQMLFYHLSQLLAYHLIKNRPAFDRFASRAHFSDAGEKALIESYRLSLQDLAQFALGEGCWGLRKPIEVHV